MNAPVNSRDLAELRHEPSLPSIHPVAPHVATRPRSRARWAGSAPDIADRSDLGPAVRALCRYRGAIATAIFWLTALMIAATVG